MLISMNPRNKRRIEPSSADAHAISLLRLLNDAIIFATSTEFDFRLLFVTSITDKIKKIEI